MYVCIYIYIYIYIYILFIYGHNMYAIVKTMCPPGYRHSGFVATHAIGHMMYDSSCTQVHELPQSHCGDNQEGT